MDGNHPNRKKDRSEGRTSRSPVLQALIAIFTFKGSGTKRFQSLFFLITHSHIIRQENTRLNSGRLIIFERRS